MAEYVKRGHSIGVRLTVKGQRKWLGSVNQRCEVCDERPAMCKECEARAMVAATGLSQRAKRQLVWKRETCGEFAGRWIHDYNTRGRWDASTIRTYERILPLFVAHFGQMALAGVERSEARSWAQRQPSAYVSCIATMFSDALKDELVDRNPFASLRLPSRGRGDIVAITEEELHLLCELGNPTTAAMIAVAGYTGIRPAELFALEPGDFRGDELDVRWQWNGHELKRPKSKKPRTVILPAEALPYLTDVPVPLYEIRVPRADGSQVLVRPLFRNARGTLWRQSSWASTWSVLRAAFEAKLPPRRAQELRDSRGGKALDWYELRHLAATMILRKGGTYDDAAHQLGHTDARLIRSTYGHLEESYKLDRLKALYGTNLRELRVAESGAEESANG